MNGAVTPLDIRLVPAALGLWVTCLLATQLGPVASLGGAALAAIAAAVLTARLRGPRARHRLAWAGWGRMTMLLACLIVAIGGSLVSATVIARERAVAPLAGLSGTVGLRIAGEPQELRASPGVYGVSADVLWVEWAGARGAWHGDVPAFVMGEVAAVRPGQRVAVPGRLSSDNGRELFLRVDGSIESDGPMTTLDDHVDRLREGLRRRVADLPPYARGLVPGVAIGDDRALPEPVGEAMRATSLTHLTAVSGGHVAVVVGTVLFALARAPAPVRAGCGLVVLAGMVVLVLPTASVVRAAGMGVVTLSAMGLRRPRLALPALAGAVITLLLIDPWQASAYGFALSVSATAGLVTWTEPLAVRLARFVPLGPARLLALPVAAQCWCAPILVLFAPAIPVYAVPANLLAALAIGPATLLGMVATVAGGVPGVADVAVPAAAWCSGWIAATAEVFASLPGALLPWPGGPVGAALLAILVVAAGVWVHGRMSVAG